MRHLAKNTTAFGLLSKKRQADFRALRDAGAKILVYDEHGEWVKHSYSVFLLHEVYRVPEVTEK